jgi:hypothetical protein
MDICPTCPASWRGRSHSPGKEQQRALLIASQAARETLIERAPNFGLTTEPAHRYSDKTARLRACWR